ncbi:NTP transferase domain-containing protein [Qipengyuania sp.]|uniref:nucleotidyltransferase family protein n=1 Tax=Qipengyuania sp. TaxID=2004515 RepID=UPI003735677C
MRRRTGCRAAEPVRAAGIVLAAGAGRRFGGRKMLAEWNGEPLIRASVRNALAAPIAELLVVAGSDADAIGEALAPLSDPRLRLVVHPRWAAGIGSTLAAGIAGLPRDTDCAVIFLGDMPRVPQHLAGDLVAAIARGAPSALVSMAGAPGHPVAAHATLFGTLGRMTGDSGARAILAAQPGCVTIPTHDPGAVYDVDRPEPPPELRIG